MKNLTIRDISQELADAIDKERRRRGKSLNQTVIQLLGQSLGVQPNGARKNGLTHLSGTWTSEEHRQFEAAIASAENIDEELWR
jgi:kynureninase